MLRHERFEGRADVGQSRVLIDKHLDFPIRGVLFSAAPKAPAAWTLQIPGERLRVLIRKAQPWDARIPAVPGDANQQGVGFAATRRGPGVALRIDRYATAIENRLGFDAFRVALQVRCNVL